MFASLRLATFALALGLGAPTFAEESHHPPAGAVARRRGARIQRAGRGGDLHRGAALAPIPRRGLRVRGVVSDECPRRTRTDVRVRPENNADPSGRRGA